MGIVLDEVEAWLAREGVHIQSDVLAVMDKGDLMSDKLKWLRQHSYFPCSVCIGQNDQDVRLFEVYRSEALRLYLDGRICEDCCSEVEPPVVFGELPVFNPFEGLIYKADMIPVFLGD